MMLDTSAGVIGTAIYKYESPDKDNQFTNKVNFVSCRGIYASPADRTAVIEKICSEYPDFPREKTFFVGAARQKMDVQQIKTFEQACPQNPAVGERFYIGTPLGIQPCFYFNLKSVESGENILLVGSDNEKRISILKSVLSCAQRYRYTVKIFASRAAQFYRQNKEFFRSLTCAEVITSFPEICKYVGEHANQINALYSDDDDADFEMDASQKKELAIFVGLDEIYTQMEASRLSQKAAWAVCTPADNPPADSAVTPESGTAAEPVQPVTPEKPEETSDSINEELMSNVADIDSFLASLDDEEEDSDSVSVSVPEKFAGPEASGIKGYNAIQDLSLLFSDGWKLGINSMVVVDRGTVFNKMRQVKLEGNFNHRIALVMSPDEAQIFMTKTNVMKTLINGKDDISAVYEYLGGRERCFRPYLFP